MSPFAHLPYRPCVGLMVVNAEGKVFVGKRIDGRGGDAWQMPQGGVDDGEELLEAGLRELHEETGIDRTLVEVLAETDTPLCYDLPSELVPRFWNGRFRGQSQHWFVMRFSGSDSDVDLNAHDPAEFCEYRWVDPGTLPDLAVAFKRGVYASLVENFAGVLRAA